MKLLTKAIQKRLPALYSTENVAAADKIAVAKFFTPFGRAAWYAVEGEEQANGDFLFFGYMQGADAQFDEWGYFSLRELEGIRVLGLGVERDKYFAPAPMGALIA